MEMTNTEDKLIDQYVTAMAKLTKYWYMKYGYSFSQIKSILSENVTEHIKEIKKYAIK